jgi:hypothetical protein
MRVRPVCSLRNSTSRGRKSNEGEMRCERRLGYNNALLNNTELRFCFRYLRGLHAAAAVAAPVQGIIQRHFPAGV